MKHRNKAIPQTQNELQFIPDKSDGDALNFPFEEANELLDDVAIVDEVIEGGMREYVRLWLLEVTDDIYREIEARRDRI